MANQLRWQPIEAPNTSQALNTVLANNTAVGDGIASLGKMFADNTARIRDKTTDDMIAKALLTKEIGNLDHIRYGALNHDSDNWRIDRSKLATALNEHEALLRTNRTDDFNWGVLQDKVKNAPAIAAQLQRLRNTGYGNPVSVAGKAGFEFIDTSLGAYGSYLDGRREDKHHNDDMKLKYAEIRQRARAASAEAASRARHVLFPD